MDLFWWALLIAVYLLCIFIYVIYLYKETNGTFQSMDTMDSIFFSTLTILVITAVPVISVICKNNNKIDINKILAYNKLAKFFDKNNLNSNDSNLGLNEGYENAQDGDNKVYWAKKYDYNDGASFEQLADIKPIYEFCPEPIKSPEFVPHELRDCKKIPNKPHWDFKFLNDTPCPTDCINTLNPYLCPKSLKKITCDNPNCKNCMLNNFYNADMQCWNNPDLYNYVEYDEALVNKYGDVRLETTDELHNKLVSPCKYNLITPRRLAVDPGGLIRAYNMGNKKYYNDIVVGSDLHRARRKRNAKLNKYNINKQVTNYWWRDYCDLNEDNIWFETRT